MIKYFKMKRDEIKVKAILYEIIVNVIDNQKDIFDLVQKLFIALKDVPIDELKAEFVKQLAEIVHKENNNKED